MKCVACSGRGVETPQKIGWRSILRLSRQLARVSIVVEEKISDTFGAYWRVGQIS